MYTIYAYVSLYKHGKTYPINPMKRYLISKMLTLTDLHSSGTRWVGEEETIHFYVYVKRTGYKLVFPESSRMCF